MLRARTSAAHCMDWLVTRPCTPGWRVTLTVLVALAVSGMGLGAQSDRTSIGPLVLERVVLDRWVHPGQHPGFVNFDSVRSPIHITGSLSSGTPSAGRTLTLKVQNIEARLLLTRANRVRSAWVDQPPITYFPQFDARAQSLGVRSRLQGPGATLSLPAARFWEVPFVMPATTLTAGMTWSDTLSFHAEGEGLMESLEGVWRNEVVGDTVISGRRFPLVRTRGDVRYRARELSGDDITDGDRAVLRDVTGSMIGYAAVDTVAGIRARGTDSTFLTGTAVLDMGGGRTFSTPVRYERQQRWTLYDSLEWKAMDDSVRAWQARQSTGMLMLPRNTLEERLRAGDPAAVDSLLARWREVEHPNERTAIGNLLRRSSNRRAIEERLRALQREAGDTAGLIAEQLSGLGSPPRYTMDVISLLDDPGRFWQLGPMPRYAYTELGNQLRAATPLLEPDSSRWPCQPDVCSAVIAMMDSANEPRLRDIALAGAFVRDPARWYDRLVARADSGSRIALTAVSLGQGIGNVGMGVRRIPMPGPGADWRAWRDWLASDAGAVRWTQNHYSAMRIYSARTGRDPVVELLREWPASEDSARLVIGTVLRGMGALAEPTPAEIVAALLAGPVADRQAALRQLPELMRPAGVPVPAALATELLRPLVDSIAARGNVPWPAARVDSSAPSTSLHSWSVNFHGVRDVPVFVLDEGLPPSIAGALPAPFTLITREGWDARQVREGGALVTVSPVRAWGDFVSLAWGWTVHERRAPDEAPRGYAGGGSLILVLTPDGWRVASSSAWIT